MIHVNVFHVLRYEISDGSDERHRIPPYTQCKMRSFFDNVMSIFHKYKYCVHVEQTTIYMGFK